MANIMKANNKRTAAWRAIIDLRRVKVSQLRSEHMNQREIMKALEAKGEYNPETGKPWSIFAVNADCQWLDRHWLNEMLKETNSQKADMLAELRAVRKVAWAKRDFVAVLRSIKQEAQLLGLDAPTRIEMSLEEKKRIVIEEIIIGLGPAQQEALRRLLGGGED